MSAFEPRFSLLPVSVFRVAKPGSECFTGCRFFVYASWKCMYHKIFIFAAEIMFLYEFYYYVVLGAPKLLDNNFVHDH